MKLDNDLFDQKFDDIDAKIDRMVDVCRRLQAEKIRLNLRIDELETAQKNNNSPLNDDYLKRTADMQSKVSQLLGKLDELSGSSARSDH